MKKLFASVTILSLLLAGCAHGGKDNNEKKIIVRKQNKKINKRTMILRISQTNRIILKIKIVIGNKRLQIQHLTKRINHLIKPKLHKIIRITWLHTIAEMQQK